MADKTESAKPGVFMSYSRDDLEFADQLNATLTLAGYESKIDHLGIMGGENWERRLSDMIRDSDAFVFVLSPSSSASKACAWEMEEAKRLGKRILPVICRPLTGDARPPPGLAALNYIFFYHEPRRPDAGFAHGLFELAKALNTDLEWLREHTRLLQRASEWDQGGRPPNRLLSGRDIDAAKQWVAAHPKDAPEPTALHFDFIRASEDEEIKRQSAEAQRLREIAVAQEQRGQALAQREEALAREAIQSRRVVRITLLGLAVAVVLASVATYFGHTARVERDTAERMRDLALVTQSKFLTDGAFAAIHDKRDAGTGLLLALEALKDPSSDDDTQRVRPFWPLAEAALGEARRTLRELRVLQGHTKWTSAVAVSPDAARIVTASADGTARVWNAATGVEIGRFADHVGVVNGLAILPDGKRVVTVADDATAKIWTLADARVDLVLQGHTAPIRAVAAFPDGRRIVTGSNDRTLRIWDAASGATLKLLSGHTDHVVSVAVTADGRRVVSGSYDRSNRIWDAESGEEITRIAGTAGGLVAVTPSGDRLLTSDTDNVARIWDARTGTLLQTLPNSGREVWAVAFSGDGRLAYVGSASGTLRIFDAATGEPRLQLHSPSDGLTAIAEIVLGQELIVGASDGTARIWDIRPGRDTAKATFMVPGDLIQRVAFSPDGSRLITGSLDLTARVWNVATGAMIAELKGHT